MADSDPQAKCVYALEDTFMKAWMRVRQPRSALQTLADKACRRWRVPPVRVRFLKSKSWAGEYDYDMQCIDLHARPNGDTGRNVPVLLHELAHHIDDCIWDEDEAHGPVFCAIAMDLFDHYKVLPARVYRLLAEEYKVKIAQLRKRKPA